MGKAQYSSEVSFLSLGRLLAAVFALLLVVAPFLSFSVAAYTLSDLAFSKDSSPITAVSPSHQQLVDVTFTTDLPSGYVYLDLRALNADPSTAASYVDQRVDLSSCVRGNGIVNCTLKNIVIMPPNATVTVPYRLFSGGSSYAGNATYTFTIDDTAPRVLSIRTAVCDENGARCYVGDGITTNVTIDLDDADGTFAKHLVFYKLGSTLFNAANCSGNTCIGAARVSCGDEVRLDLKVVAANGVPSQDDAGNPVSNPGEVQRVICDAQPPKVVSVSINGTGPLGLVADNGQLLLTAVVRDAVTIVTMTAQTKDVQLNASENASVSVPCVRTENDLQECKLSIDHLRNGTSLSLPLVFTDAVGHNVTRRESVRILAVGGQNETPDFFSAKATKVTPETIDRVALQLALDNAIDYPLFINYKLTQLTPKTRILQQKLKTTTCQAVAQPKRQYSDYFAAHDDENWTTTPALFIDPIRVFYPGADWRQENRLDASFLKMDTSQLASDIILVRCNLSLTVQKGNTIYPVPEQETLYWPVRLRNSPLGTPGKAFLEKIDAEQGKLNSGLIRMIGTANKITTTFAHLCQMQQLINMIQVQGLSMESIGLMCMYTGACANLAGTGNGLYNRMMGTTLTYWLGKAKLPKIGDKAQEAADKVGSAANKELADAQTKTRKFCSYIHCDIANRTAASKSKLITADDDWLKTGKLEKNEYVGSYFSNLNTPDVSNSLIMSIATKCWGGVVYNLNKYRQIDCGYLECLKEQALNGASIAPCEEARGVKQCRFITGEIFELPYIRVIKNLLANINQIIQAPIGLVLNKLSVSACVGKDKEITWGGFGCHLMKTITVQKDFQSVTQYNQIFSFPPDDLCRRALCEGDACGRTSNSLIEQIGGTGYPADLYRDQLIREHEQQAKYQDAQAVIDSLEQVGPEQGIHWYCDPAFKNYVDKYNINDEDAKNLWYALNDPGEVVEGGVTYGQANRNVFLSRAESGKPVTSGQALTAATASGVVDAKLLGSNSLENQQIADTLSSYQDMLTDNSNPLAGCQNGHACSSPALPPACDPQNSGYNPDKCDKNAYTSIVGNLASFNYVPCKNGAGQLGICPCAQWSEDKKSCTDVKLDKFVDKKGIEAAQEQAEEAGAKAKRAENFYGWVDAMGSVLYQYLREKGQIDFLFLSGWGDWGAALSAKANKLLNPEEWKNNLCNPAGSFSDYTQDDGTVYAWSDAGAYRAVLTFAGERLPYETRASNPDAPVQNLYTLSVVAVSPDNDNTMSVVLNPGNRVVDKDIVLAEANPVSWSKAVNDTRSFDEVCVVFDKEFPQPGGERTYCRQLQRNAYDRGGVTNETLPDIGVDDPWAIAATTNTAGSGGMGGLDFGGAQ